jgi:lysophospholipase L1-like esterase
MRRASAAGPARNVSALHLFINYLREYIVSKRQIIQWIEAVLISVVFAFFAVGAFVFIELKMAKASGRDASRFIRRNQLLSKIFLDEDYKRLMDALVENELMDAVDENERRDQVFSTVWDFDAGVLLSRRMFEEVDMFGQTKYRYRPNITIHYLRVWSGLRYESLEFVETEDIKPLLEKVDFYRDVYFETDENGFKKTAFPFEPAAPKVFFLGDSFTEGLFVKPENTFVNQFGMKLKENGVHATPLNLGVNGYSAKEMSWTLETFAPLFHPKIVIVNLFPNDVHADYNKVVQGDGIPESNYTRMFKYLQRMSNYCRDFNIALVIAVIPPKKQLGVLHNFSAFQDRVREWCNGQGVLFLDPRAFFGPLGADKLYFSWDPHFSSAGHKYYAEFLYRELAPIITKKNSPS